MVRATGVLHATLAVWDLGRAERFYRELLGIARHPTPSYFPEHVVFLDLGNTMIHLIRDNPALPRPNPHATSPDEGDDEAAFQHRQEAAQRLRLHVAIVVDDLDAARERVLALGRPIVQDVMARQDGLRCFYFLDTEHNRVELAQY